MGSFETLFLRWNDFESGIKAGFSQLQSDEDFCDITLACGNRQIKAHKMILATYSPFFKSLLKSLNPAHAHPLLYLRGIPFHHLESVLSFMYHGEVRVKTEDLDAFLDVAEDLQVNGLVINGSISDSSNNVTRPEEPRSPSPPFATPANGKADFQANVDDFDFEIEEILQQEVDNGSPTDMSPCRIEHGSSPTMDFPITRFEDPFEPSDIEDELDNNEPDDTLETTNENFNEDEDIRKLYKHSKTDKVRRYRCNMCPYFTNVITNIKKHIRCNHLMSNEFPCNKCDGRLKTKKALAIHKYRMHNIRSTKRKRA